MNHWKKRLLCMTFAAIMAVSTTGCAKGSSEQGTNAAPEAGSANGEDAAQDTASKEKIKLTFWHIWPNDEMSEIVDNYIEIYEKENPNVTIESVATQEVEYQNTKLKVAASTGAQGDVFMSWGGGYSQTFVDAGVVMPLDDYYKENDIQASMLDGALTYGTYDGKIYGFPLKQWAGVLFCNQDLFDQYNVEIPKTWDQLLTAVETFRANDVTPMVLGAKDAWHIGMIQNALAVRTAGPDYVNKALIGEESMNTKEIAESAKLLTDLSKAGAFVNGTMGIGAEEAQEEFYMGMVPMYFGGSWVASACDSEENEISNSKITVTQMPTVDGGKGDATTYSGGVIDFMMVNANTKYPKEACDFAYGMTKYMSEECYKIGDSLPAWKLAIDESEVSPTLVAVKELIQDSTGYVLAWDTFLSGAAIDSHYQLLQGLIAGTITPEEFAEGMQEAIQK